MFLAGPPALADAYDREPVVWVAQAAPEVVPARLTPRDPDGDRKHFRRKYQEGRRGASITLAGQIIALVGGVALGVECPRQDTFNQCAQTDGLPYLLLGAAGGVTAVVGEVMLFDGALGAASEARRLGVDVSSVMGWSGVTLAIGGTIFSYVGDDSIALGGSIASLVGLVLGAVQLDQVRNAGYRGGLLTVVPTGRGAAVVARF